MFIIAINLWFKFSGKIFANIYSITACSFFIIGWIRWSSSSGVALWCLVPHISLASCSLVLAAALHRNSVTSSPVYYRWSDRHRFYLCQKALTLGSSHVMNLSLHQTAWYGVILQKWYHHCYWEEQKHQSCSAVTGEQNESDSSPWKIPSETNVLKSQHSCTFSAENNEKSQCAWEREHLPLVQAWQEHERTYC